MDASPEASTSASAYYAPLVEEAAAVGVQQPVSLAHRRLLLVSSDFPRSGSRQVPQETDLGDLRYEHLVAMSSCWKETGGASSLQAVVEWREEARPELCLLVLSPWLPETQA